MKRHLVLAGLIIVAALTRLLPHPPNFAPITALAVFGGVTYGSRWAAILVPLAALLLSDLILQRASLDINTLATTWELYPGMWVVYATTACIALIGRWAQSRRSPLLLAAVTLAGSCLFFVVTNFAFWAEGRFYPLTTEGLMTCYLAALPYFQNSLLGDAVYALLLFGTWAAVQAGFPALRPEPRPATT